MGRRTANGLGAAALAFVALLAGACEPAPSGLEPGGAEHPDVPGAALEELAHGRDAEQLGLKLEAIAAYARAAEIAPEWAEPHRLCVPVARSAGDLATARESLLWLLEHEPRTADHGAALVQVGLRLGDLDLARRGLEQLAELEPGRPRTHLAAARLAFEGGRLSLATREARLAVQKDPRLAEAHYILGVAADERGDDETALASWRRALEADPGHLGARDLYATGLLRAGRVEEAEQQRALHGAVTTVHAAGFKKQGAAARAAILEPLLDELPPWPYAEVELAEAWMELGRNAEALPLLRSVLERENTTATHALLFEVLTALGKHEAAARHGRLAGVLPPDASTGTSESERRP